MYRLSSDKPELPCDDASAASSKGKSLLDQFDEDASQHCSSEKKPQQSESPIYDILEDEDEAREAGQESEPPVMPTLKSKRQRPRHDIAPQDKQQLSGKALVNSLADITPLVIVGWLRRFWLIIALSMIITSALALTYAAMTPPRYSAYTDVVINPSNLNVVGDGVFTPAQQRDTQVLEVESKLRTLTSRNVLERAVVALKLDEDPEFTDPSPLQRLKSLWNPVPDGDKAIGALRGLNDRVSAVRDNRSFVVTLSVWSNDPEKSVKISKAIMDGFEQELLASSADGSRRAVTDLNLRLDELRRNVTEAEKAVEDFRRDNGLQQLNGQLTSDQASSELNVQVLAAQQRYIQEQSRYNQMETAIRQNRAATAAIFDSQTMNTIREQHSLLQQQIGAMTQTYGSRHPRLSSAGAERQMLEQGMLTEARRILEMARSARDEAKAAFDALQKQADSKQERVFADKATLVTLRDLERNARSVAAIYETYLTRARQIAEQQTIDINNIRVISQPVAPNYRTWPPSKLVFLIGGLTFGAILGSILAVGLGLLSLLRHSLRKPA